MARKNKSFARNQTAFETKNPIELYTSRYFNYFMSIAISRYKWTGLPDEIVPQFLEKILFENQRAVFFKDSAVDMYAVMRVNLGGTMDIYDIPNDRYAYAINYGQSQLSKKDSVIIWDNLTQYPLSDYIYMHSLSLAKMRLTRDINILAQRTPVLISSNADSQLTASNIINKYNEFIPYIMLDDTIANDIDKTIKALDLRVPAVFDKVQVAMQKEKSEALTLLGVDSNGVDKAERMISGEVQGNNGEIEMNRRNGIDLRKRAAKQINKMFGLNVDVNFNTVIPITDDPDRADADVGDDNIADGGNKK